jgi:hypothetical protein
LKLGLGAAFENSNLPLDILDKEIFPWCDSMTKTCFAFVCKYFSHALVLNPFFECIYDACERGHLDLLKFFYSGLERPWFPQCLNFARFHIHFSIIEWLEDSRDKIDSFPRESNFEKTGNLSDCIAEIKTAPNYPIILQTFQKPDPNGLYAHSMMMNLFDCRDWYLLKRFEQTPHLRSIFYSLLLKIRGD